MAHKAIRARYYWPSMQKDAAHLARRCNKCQQFANIPRRPVEELTPMIGPWPFAQWGINIVARAAAQGKKAAKILDSSYQLLH